MNDVIKHKVWLLKPAISRVTIATHNITPKRKVWTFWWASSTVLPGWGGSSCPHHTPPPTGQTRLSYSSWSSLSGWRYSHSSSTGGQNMHCGEIRGSCALNGNLLKGFIEQNIFSKRLPPKFSTMKLAIDYVLRLLLACNEHLMCKKNFLGTWFPDFLHSALNTIRSGVGGAKSGMWSTIRYISKLKIPKSLRTR